MHTQRLLTAARHIGLTLVVGALALAGLALLGVGLAARLRALRTLFRLKSEG